MTGRERRWRDWRLAAAFASGGLLWCVVAGLLIWFVPWGTSVSTSSTGETTTGPGESFASISAYGPLPLLVPVGLTAIALWATLSHHRVVLIAATALLALYALLGGFTIGLAYVPAVLALVAAGMATSGVREDPEGGPGQGGTSA